VIDPLGPCNRARFLTISHSARRSCGSWPARPGPAVGPRHWRERRSSA
jgi:hypothetical protein